MAEKDGKKKPEAEKSKAAGGKKKKHLHQVITTKAKDGTFGHEHVYKDHADDAHSNPPVFAGTSHDMEDLHSHMDDHFGAGAEQAEAEPGEGEAAAAAGGPPAGGQQPA